MDPEGLQDPTPASFEDLRALAGEALDRVMRDEFALSEA
jgi:hypothetical protein